jgi:predicted RNase H-like HicB family nuclease
MRYAIVIEKADENFSAYLPDVPGCVTTGQTVRETIENMKEALTGHLKLMAEDGEASPPAESCVDYVEVELPAVAHPSRQP